MPSVNNFILTFNTESEVDYRIDDSPYKIVESINVEIRNVYEAESNAFVRVDHLAGGSKVMEADLCIGAMNYSDPDVVAKIVFAAPWHYPAQVQLFVRTQHAEIFRELPNPHVPLPTIPNRRPMALTNQQIDEQREQIQNDVQCILDGLEEQVIDRVCQVVVDRLNILKSTNCDRSSQPAKPLLPNP